MDKIKGFRLIARTEKVIPDHMTGNHLYHVTVPVCYPLNMRIGWSLVDNRLIDPADCSAMPDRPSIRLDPGYSQYMHEHEDCFWINSSMIADFNHRTQVFSMRQSIYVLAKKLVLGICQAHSNNILALEDVWENP
jgi:hypothetical protein